MPELRPWDQYNEALLANAHPVDWKNPEPAASYNLVVIGGGTAGLVCAAGAAGLGARVALVERHLMGGDCLNYGCVPSKAVIRSSRIAADLRAADRFGVKIPTGAEVDFPAVMERMRRLRAQISRHDSAQRLRELGVDVFLGEARFTGARTVEVTGKTLNFTKAVVATGGRPVQPSLPGIEAAGFLTNETVFSLTERPPRLLVIGAGPIGCEFAQAFQRLGCQVSLLHKHPLIMNREDGDAAGLIQNIFIREGINLILEAIPVQVSPTPTGKLLRFASGGATGEIEVDEILVGAGRAPKHLEGVRAFQLFVGLRVIKGRHSQFVFCLRIRASFQEHSEIFGILAVSRGEHQCGLSVVVLSLGVGASPQQRRDNLRIGIVPGSEHQRGITADIPGLRSARPL